MSNYISHTAKHQFTKFVLVGILNTSISFVFFSILIVLLVPYKIANVFSFLIGMLSSFILNKRWTFNQSSKTNKMLLVKFTTVNVLALSTSLGTVVFFVESVNINEYISQIFAIGGSTIINFFGQKYFVFKRKVE